MKKDKELTVQGIVELTSAYYGSSVLFAALEIDLFSLVAREGGLVTVDTAAELVGCNRRGIGLLLDACVAVGLLRKQKGEYSNTDAAAAALVAGAPQDLTKAAGYNRDVYGAWGRLGELVKSGKPVEAPELHLGDDTERTRRFVLAMRGRAMGIGRLVIPMLDLGGCRMVLDLAGGPGTYAVLMAQAHPELTCVTVDLPAVSEVADELVKDAGMDGRVICRAGNYHEDTYEPGHYDAVTIFGALHQESPEMIVRILKCCYAALRPGGRVYVLDMMTDETHTWPPFSALFAVNMALTTYHGWVFSDAELYGWLSEAGFESCVTSPVPPPMPHWLVSAVKPAG
ncbi:MAG: methyltransferase [Kiritimatiellae bacterium]|nr:methyltransferase [Kiritimatiellia bacterium]